MMHTPVAGLIDTQKLADMCLDNNVFTRAKGSGYLRAALEVACGSLRCIAADGGDPSGHAAITLRRINEMIATGGAV